MEPLRFLFKSKSRRNVPYHLRSIYGLNANDRLQIRSSIQNICKLIVLYRKVKLLSKTNTKRKTILMLLRSDVILEFAGFLKVVVVQGGSDPQLKFSIFD